MDKILDTSTECEDDCSSSISMQPINPLYTETQPILSSKINLPFRKLIDDLQFRQHVHRGAITTDSNTSTLYRAVPGSMAAPRSRATLRSRAVPVSIDVSNHQNGKFSSTISSSVKSKKVESRIISNVITKWEVDIRNEDLVILGFSLISKEREVVIVKRRVTNNIFLNDKNDPCSLIGDMIKSANVPIHIYSQFEKGIPDNWKSTVMIWKAYLSCGSPENFPWCVHEDLINQGTKDDVIQRLQNEVEKYKKKYELERIRYSQLLSDNSVSKFSLNTIANNSNGSQLTSTNGFRQKLFQNCSACGNVISNNSINSNSTTNFSNSALSGFQVFSFYNSHKQANELEQNKKTDNYVSENTNFSTLNSPNLSTIVENNNKEFNKKNDVQPMPVKLFQKKKLSQMKKNVIDTFSKSNNCSNSSNNITSIKSKIASRELTNLSCKYFSKSSVNSLDSSIDSTVVSSSSRGRLLIPTLQYWRGERLSHLNNTPTSLNQSLKKTNVEKIVSKEIETQKEIELPVETVDNHLQQETSPTLTTHEMNYLSPKANLKLQRNSNLTNSSKKKLTTSSFSADVLNSEQDDQSKLGKQNSINDKTSKNNCDSSNSLSSREKLQTFNNQLNQESNATSSNNGQQNQNQLQQKNTSTISIPRKLLEKLLKAGDRMSIVESLIRSPKVIIPIHENLNNSITRAKFQEKGYLVKKNLYHEKSNNDLLNDDEQENENNKLKQGKTSTTKLQEESEKLDENLQENENKLRQVNVDKTSIKKYKLNNQFISEKLQNDENSVRKKSEQIIITEKNSQETSMYLERRRNSALIESVENNENIEKQRQNYEDNISSETSNSTKKTPKNKKLISKQQLSSNVRKEVFPQPVENLISSNSVSEIEKNTKTPKKTKYISSETSSNTKNKKLISKQQLSSNVRKEVFPQSVENLISSNSLPEIEKPIKTPKKTKNISSETSSNTKSKKLISKQQLSPNVLKEVFPQPVENVTCNLETEIEKSIEAPRKSKCVSSETSTNTKNKKIISKQQLSSNVRKKVFSQPVENFTSCNLETEIQKSIETPRKSKYVSSKTSSNTKNKKLISNQQLSSNVRKEVFPQPIKNLISSNSESEIKKSFKTPKKIKYISSETSSNTKNKKLISKQQLSPNVQKEIFPQTVENLISLNSVSESEKPIETPKKPRKNIKSKSISSETLNNIKNTPKNFKQQLTSNVEHEIFPEREDNLISRNVETEFAKLAETPRKTAGKSKSVSSETSSNTKNKKLTSYVRNGIFPQTVNNFISSNLQTEIAKPIETPRKTKSISSETSSNTTNKKLISKQQLSSNVRKEVFPQTVDNFISFNSEIEVEKTFKTPKKTVSKSKSVSSATLNNKKNTPENSKKQLSSHVQKEIFPQIRDNLENGIENHIETGSKTSRKNKSVSKQMVSTSTVRKTTVEDNVTDLVENSSNITRSARRSLRNIKRINYSESLFHVNYLCDYLTSNLDENLEKNKRKFQNETSKAEPKLKKIKPLKLPSNPVEMSVMFQPKKKRKQKGVLGALILKTQPQNETEKLDLQNTVGKKKQLFSQEEWMQSEEFKKICNLDISEERKRPQFVINFNATPIYNLDGDDEFSEVSCFKNCDM